MPEDEFADEIILMLCCGWWLVFMWMWHIPNIQHTYTNIDVLWRTLMSECTQCEAPYHASVIEHHLQTSLLDFAHKYAVAFDVQTFMEPQVHKSWENVHFEEINLNLNRPRKRWLVFSFVYGISDILGVPLPMARSKRFTLASAEAAPPLIHGVPFIYVRKLCCHLPLRILHVVRIFSAPMLCVYGVDWSSEHKS